MKMIKIIVFLNIFLFGLSGCGAPKKVIDLYSPPEEIIAREAGNLAKEVRSAISKGIKKIERIKVIDENWYQISITLGIPATSPSTEYVPPPSNNNIKKGNISGTYYMGLPVNPTLEGSKVPKFYFPKLDSPVNNYQPIQIIDTNAGGKKFRVFYFCKWHKKRFKKAEPIYTPLKTKSDIRRQLSYRILAEPDTELWPKKTIIPGLWKFQIQVYFRYSGDTKNTENSDLFPHWWYYSKGADKKGDPNIPVNSIIFKALIRT